MAPYCYILLATYWHQTFDPQERRSHGPPVPAAVRPADAGGLHQRQDVRPGDGEVAAAGDSYPACVRMEGGINTFVDAFLSFRNFITKF